MKKANILATAALATLLAACSNDSDVFNTPDYADTPIGLNVNVSPMATRAGYEQGALTEGSFGLYLTTEGTNSDERYNCTNREVKYDNGWTIQGGQLLWKSNDATVTYYAYLPYTGTVSDATTMPLRCRPTRAPKITSRLPTCFVPDSNPPHPERHSTLHSNMRCPS